MILYFYTDPTGFIVSRGNVPYEENILNKEGCTLYRFEAPAEYNYYIDNEFKYIPTVEEQTGIVNTRRLQLLAVSDWTQNNDTPLSEEDVQKWKEYRQQLRDITDQEGYPFNVVWPIKP